MDVVVVASIFCCCISVADSFISTSVRRPVDGFRFWTYLLRDGIAFYRSFTFSAETSEDSKSCKKAYYFSL